MSKTKIFWLGHASIKIEGGGKTVFFDPWVQDNPVCTTKLNQIKKADAICVTHGHIDHIGDSLALVKSTGAPLICSPEIGMYAEKFGGIKYDEGSIPLNIGGGLGNQGFHDHDGERRPYFGYHGRGLQAGRNLDAGVRFSRICD